MNRVSRNKKKMLIALVMCTMLVCGLCITGLAADPNDIDRTATGTLAVQPRLVNGDAVAGGTFNVYTVALLDNSVPHGQLRYVLEDEFDPDGSNYMDISWIQVINQGPGFVGAESLADASEKLAELAGDVPDSKVILLSVDNGYKASDLALGIYLVVQTSGIEDYSDIAPFLVFIPTTNADSAGWDAIVTAYPKL